VNNPALHPLLRDLTPAQHLVVSRARDMTKTCSVQWVARVLRAYGVTIELALLVLTGRVVHPAGVQSFVSVNGLPL
jgi:hypothetical protein